VSARKFTPKASFKELCTEAGRRGGLKHGNKTLPRKVTTLADISGHKYTASESTDQTEP